MSKPLHQIVVFSENYDQNIEDEVNAWLSNRANDIYEHKITFFAAETYICAAIEYWEQ